MKAKGEEEEEEEEEKNISKSSKKKTVLYPVSKNPKKEVFQNLKMNLNLKKLERLRNHRNLNYKIN
jgi:hypothetical protein